MNLVFLFKNMDNIDTSITIELATKIAKEYKDTSRNKNIIARHGQLDLVVNVIGDLEVDEHHTFEDTRMVLNKGEGRNITTRKPLNYL